MLIYQITHRLCDWFLKSVRGGLAKAKVPCLKNLDALLARIDDKKPDVTLKDTYEIVWPDT